jgi:Concanavalin A-like lectin/glucanases superfamily
MGTQYVGTVIGDTPHTYLRLDEPSGTSAYDASGNTLTGTYNGTVTLAQSGAIISDSDTSVLLNGTTGYVSLPAGAKADGLAAFSVECWFYLSNITYVNTPRLVSGANTTSTNTGFDLFLTNSGAGIQFFVGNGTTNAGFNYVHALSASTWYHVIGVYDGTNAYLYFNGVAQGHNALTGTIGAAGVNPTVGRIASSSANFFPGRIDEVSLYTSALSSTQVSNHYNNAVAANTTLYTVSPVGTRIIQIEDLNQITNTCQRPTGDQEVGHYVLAMPAYTSGASVSWYVPSLSRVSVPVSVSVDAADITNVGFSTSPPSVDHFSAGGFHVFDSAVTSAQPNPIIGGNYTLAF